MVGTNEAVWAGGLNIYPNPTGNLLTVEIPRLAVSATLIQTRLVDLTGRTVRQPARSAFASQMELDLNGLPAGVYFLEVTDAAGGRAMRRVIKR